MSDAETANATKLIVHPNRHATFVTADGRQVSLRPPTIDEFRSIRDAYAAAGEAEIEAEKALPTLPPETPGGALRVKTIDRDAILAQGATAEAFSHMLDTIGSSGVKPGDLPLWAGQPAIYLLLANLWRQIPMEESGKDDSEPEAEFRPSFDPDDSEAPEALAEPEPRWPDVDPTAGQTGLQPGPVRTPARA